MPLIGGSPSLDVAVHLIDKNLDSLILRDLPGKAKESSENKISRRGPQVDGFAPARDLSVELLGRQPRTIAPQSGALHDPAVE